MDKMHGDRKSVSITQFAGLYVVCLVVGGLSILNIFLHANSPSTVVISALAGIAAVAGLAFSARRLVQTFNP